MRLEIVYEDNNNLLLSESVLSCNLTCLLALSSSSSTSFCFIPTGGDLVSVVGGTYNIIGVVSVGMLEKVQNMYTIYWTKVNKDEIVWCFVIHGWQFQPIAGRCDLRLINIYLSIWTNTYVGWFTCSHFLIYVLQFLACVVKKNTNILGSTCQFGECETVLGFRFVDNELQQEELS